MGFRFLQEMTLFLKNGVCCWVVLDCVEQPELGFDLKFLGGDVAALPGVEKLIDVSCYLLSIN